MGPIIFFIILCYSFIFMRKVKKEASRDGILTTNEKIQVIITEIFNPVIAGAIYYYGWKKRLPTKAKQANKYSFTIVGIGIAILVIIGILGSLSK